MTKSALLVVDVQNDYFPSGKYPLPGMPRVAAVAATAIQKYRERNLPVIFIQHVELDPSGTFFLPKTAGAEIAPTVQPRQGEPIVVKHFPNSFRETSLQATLQSLGVQRLIICGAMSNMCIDATVRAAADLGYECRVLHDACAAGPVEFGGVALSADQVHAAFMGALASGYAEVISVAELI